MPSAARLAVLMLFFTAAAALSQSDPARVTPKKATQSWIIEYQRAPGLHAALGLATEPAAIIDRARLILEVSADSVAGTIVSLAADAGPPRVIRGTVRGNTWSLRVEPPAPTMWDAVMAWLRENIHGILPTQVAYDLVVDGAAMRGTRTVIDVAGKMVSKPYPVTGKAEAPAR